MGSFFIHLCCLVVKNPSSFEPLACSRTNTVEFISSWISDRCSPDMGSSKTYKNSPPTFEFTEFGSHLNCFSSVTFRLFLIYSKRKQNFRQPRLILRQYYLFNRAQSFIHCTYKPFFFCHFPCDCELESCAFYSELGPKSRDYIAHEYRPSIGPHSLRIPKIYCFRNSMSFLY